MNTLIPDSICIDLFCNELDPIDSIEHRSLLTYVFWTRQRKQNRFRDQKLPGALVSIGYHEVKSKIERKVRAWKKNQNNDNEANLNNEEDPNLPKM